MRAYTDIRERPPGLGSRFSLAAPPLRASPAPARPIVPERWIPAIFASKTAASGLLALLVAFVFNLDQPKWALLTVFIVAQPQSGLKLVGQATEIKRLSASAIFEDPDLRRRSNSFRMLDISMLRVTGIGRFLEDSLSSLARFNESFATAL